MSSDLHPETLAVPTRKVFDQLAARAWVSTFYLAGGTALALRLGHRISVDLDFFSEAEFNEDQLIGELSSIGTLEILQKAPQSLTGVLDGVKFSFLGYPYPMLNNGEAWNGITIASIEDIGCMKIDALSSRGTKRDFIDVYFIAKRMPMTALLRLFERKYAAIRYNLLHVKKSLVYFEDAESDPMPRMIVPATWEEVKQFFVSETQNL
jgi:predicted nucleotidyltransferase component of viral defense system